MSIELGTMVAAIASTLVYYKPKNMNDFHTAGSVYDAIGPARSTRTQMFELNTLKLAFSSDSVHAAMDKLAIRLNGIGILVKNHLPQKLVFVHRVALDFHIFCLLETIQSS